MTEKTKSDPKLPWQVEATKVYGGDVRNMSGHMEPGYWLDRWAVVDAEGERILVSEHKDIAEFIAQAVNTFGKEG